MKMNLKIYMDYFKDLVAEYTVDLNISLRIIIRLHMTTVCYAKINANFLKK